MLPVTYRCRGVGGRRGKRWFLWVVWRRIVLEVVKFFSVDCYLKVGVKTKL